MSRTLLPLFIGVEQGEAGRWGGWRPVSRCSVTCGQGIQKENAYVYIHMGLVSEVVMEKAR